MSTSALTQKLQSCMAASPRKDMAAVDRAGWILPIHLSRYPDFTENRR
jgi:hypothetical protein